MEEKIFRKRFIVALFNFLLIASIGTLLRYVFVHELKIVADYKNVLHAHSHIAMMGWVFMALFGALLCAFAPQSSNKKNYSILFWINQVNCLVLVVNFWLHGYNLVSILLSTVYVAITYFFAFSILRDSKSVLINPLAKKLLHLALFFLFLSTIGLWAIGPVLTNLHGSEKVIWYYLLVQFYIHFQYNGWFIFSCLALFFSMYKQGSEKKTFYVFPAYWMMACTLTTYCLSIFWGFPEHHYFLNISVIAAVLQLFFTIQLFVKNKMMVKEILYGLKPGVKILFIISFSALIIKQLLQIIIIYPEMAHASFVLRNYVIAYLHLTFLGVTTVFILGYGLQKNALRMQSKFTWILIYAAVLSVFIIELLLSVMGSLSWAGMNTIPLFYKLVFACSLTIVISLFIVFWKNFFSIIRKTE